MFINISLLIKQFLTSQLNNKGVRVKHSLTLLEKIKTNAKITGLSMFTLLMLKVDIKAQQRKLVYDIIKNGDVIGTINFEEQKIDNKKILKLTSLVKTKFIFSLSDYCEEAASFESDVLLNSSFHQKRNGSDKVEKLTISAGEGYRLKNNGTVKLFKCDPIRYNTILLYASIPENITKVYSGNYQKLLDLKKIDQHIYRLTLPDGYNYYTYTNGVCSKVVVERTFFTLQFVLKTN